MIDFTRGHTGVIGRTRSGKTYTTIRSLERDKRGVLFFNLQQEEDVPKSFIEADGNSSSDALFDCLAAGEKINFLPSVDLQQAQRQLTGIIRALYDGEKHNIVLAVDEAHLFKGEALNALMRVATTGLRWGITLVPITQRLAKMHNDLMTQLVQMVCFETNNEGPYFKQYDIPHEEIEVRLRQGGQYSYCVFDGRDVSGPFKLGAAIRR